VSAPIQYAAVTAYGGGKEIEAYLSASRRILKALGSRCAKRLHDTGLKLCSPAGAFYLFLDFSPISPRGIRTSDALCAKVLEETGVVLLSGEAFMRPEEEMTARLAYVIFDGGEAMAAAGAAVSDQFLEEQCPRVLEGIERLANWVKSHSG
jgi:aspartate aminotransferase